MSRHHSQKSYGHNIKLFDDGYCRLYWSVDRYYAGSRLRFPTEYTRNTDKAGGRRFAKRWGLQFPGDRPAA